MEAIGGEAMDLRIFLRRRRDGWRLTGESNPEPAAGRGISAKDRCLDNMLFLAATCTGSNRCVSDAMAHTQSGQTVPPEKKLARYSGCTP